MKKVMAGIDLHSNNVVIGIMDMDGKRVRSGKLPCDLKEIAKFLAPFKKRLEQVAVIGFVRGKVRGLRILGIAKSR